MILIILKSNIGESEKLKPANGSCLYWTPRKRPRGTPYYQKYFNGVLYILIELDKLKKTISPLDELKRPA